MTPPLTYTATVGQVICFRVTGEKRRINNDEWFIESDSSVVRRREAEQTNFAYVPVEPIDPARVTIAEPPERFYRDEDGKTIRDRQNKDWWADAAGFTSAGMIIGVLNQLHEEASK